MNAKAHDNDGMTSRQRLLAAYAGEPTDRLPYWAKVTNTTWRTSQPQGIRDMSDLDLLDYIHADGMFGTPKFVRVIRPHVRVETESSLGVLRRFPLMSPLF